ncbi:MAG TPA: alpha/beta fold hydrolase [Candidatus Krumholzibacteria bacterium]|nr:alpha/beta fold hydrolase [Candidatus Krumholzibacteria bacterium]
MRTLLTITLLAVLALAAAPASAADPTPATLEGVAAALDRIQARFENLDHRLDTLEKLADDGLWFDRLGDVAFIDKVRIYGPPRWKENSPTAIGAGNPVKFWCYVFFPKDLDTGRKAPLLVFPHGGVHADFTTYYVHIVRELLAQGYVVVAPEYRGSTGYGKGTFQDIDYGGLEVEDNDAARRWVLDNYGFVDAGRVGMIGWSHGGLISLMNVMAHPDDYRCAYAGVPVSDLIARLGYLDDEYRDLYSADYHIGQTVTENIAEYKRRSPAWNAEKLRTPVLIHTNTSDEDVNSLEVVNLINALKAAGKDFEYEIFQDAPGGHSFDRLDTKGAREIRVKVYRYLAKYLQPPRPIGKLDELDRAGYPAPARD